MCVYWRICVYWMLCVYRTICVYWMICVYGMMCVLNHCKGYAVPLIRSLPTLPDLFFRALQKPCSFLKSHGNLGSLRIGCHPLECLVCAVQVSFAKKALHKLCSFPEETWQFREPKNRCHPHGCHICAVQLSFCKPASNCIPIVGNRPLIIGMIFFLERSMVSVLLCFLPRMSHLCRSLSANQPLIIGPISRNSAANSNSRNELWAKIFRVVLCHLECLVYAGQWGFYRNVIRMRWDCGKNPILISVWLIGIPSHSPIALSLCEKCAGDETVQGQVPIQEHETFSKNTSCMFLKNIHTRCFLWESFVFLEGDLTYEPFRSRRIFWRGSVRWENAMGFL